MSGILRFHFLHHQHNPSTGPSFSRPLHPMYEKRTGPAHAPAATARTIASCTRRCKSMRYRDEAGNPERSHLPSLMISCCSLIQLYLMSWLVLLINTTVPNELA
ncbi:unnamed protein product [Cercopithifilaria johnstoni]|uniref:Uncharacterized protein n=1 Tax=Cercopithifilaria johnstoni TaxID=2874296 RepID=A0A8J2LLR6_9BILA|nr:unnamed protein product [Cercopithifilaria johnstoni]